MSSATTAKNTGKSTSSREFTREELNQIVEKLTTARIALLLQHPFFGNMATRLELVDASDWCSTLATDGRRFYYNNEFVFKLKPKELEFGFAHEVLHNVFDHLSRREGREADIANIAADYAVNQITADEKIGKFPSFMQVFQDNRYRGWSFEQIYSDIYKKSKNGMSLEELGELLDQHLDGTGKDGAPPLTPEERQQIREELQEAIISAANASAGRVPAGIARMITDFTEPKMDWRQMLRLNIQSIFKNNFSFSRPSRKSQHTGAILPGLLNDETIDVAIAIDMSGSISDQQAKDFLSEVKGIMDEYVDFKIDLWCFDTAVYNYEKFSIDNAEDILEYKVKGGGGTAFEANWDFMKEIDIEPKRFIMFTDGYPCGSWGDPDYCETLFIIHGNNSIVAPFGQTAYYEE